MFCQSVVNNEKGLTNVLVKIVISSVLAAEKVRQTRVSQLHKGKSTDNVCDKPERPPLKSLPGVVVELLKNPPFLFTTLGGICDFFIGSGIATFLPKYLLNNFHVSSSQAGIYSGVYFDHFLIRIH